MEVQRVTKASVSRLGYKEPAAKDSISFDSVMDKKQSDMTLDSLNKKMREIESHGEKLIQSQTIDNLRKYKKLVKDFLNDAVKNGMQLKEERGFNQYGSSKVYKLVKQVDKKLNDITDTVLDQGNKGLDLLGLVGEVKGLLINLYT